MITVIFDYRELFLDTIVTVIKDPPVVSYDEDFFRIFFLKNHFEISPLFLNCPKWCLEIVETDVYIAFDSIW